ncbi:transcriptional regulator [Pseudomonas mucidolens]|uniref:Addiction module antidote protein n=1 Tax=Pseudomonas mucidolens TaxID=46679 RepID=A0A1H2NDV4_9PSED|nr:transcriptional regulator [Pseudomonas mucidolens]SDV03647.1 hypothetical protein SAMN05216202_3519 [Pseudomonas mucidolens]SQH32135.1 Uncharacterised protein [Pseudomonas mucidolens]
MKGRPHDEAMAEQFHADPDYAAELAILLRQMAKAFGQGEGWSLTDAERKLSST